MNITQAQDLQVGDLVDVENFLALKNDPAYQAARYVYFTVSSVDQVDSRTVLVDFLHYGTYAVLKTQEFPTL